MAGRSDRPFGTQRKVKTGALSPCQRPLFRRLGLRLLVTLLATLAFGAGLEPLSERAYFIEPLIAAWAAANRAIGTRNGEQLT